MNGSKSSTSGGDRTKFLVLLYAPAVLLLAAIAVVAETRNVPIAHFTRDPATTTGSNPFLGLMSNAGVLMWWATVVVCFIGWRLLRNDRNDPMLGRFLAASGLFTALLAADDLFLLHEVTYPRVHPFFSETVAYAGYAALSLIGVVSFRRCILRTNYPLAFCAMVFFALSIGVDMTQESFEAFLGGWRPLVEDGSKFLGVVTWFGYFLHTMLTAVRRRFEPRV